MHGFHREIGRRYHVGEGIETARRLFLRQSERRRQRVSVQCCMVFVVGFAEDEDDFGERNVQESTASDSIASCRLPIALRSKACIRRLKNRRSGAERRSRQSSGSSRNNSCSHARSCMRESRQADSKAEALDVSPKIPPASTVVSRQVRRPAWGIGAVRRACETFSSRRLMPATRLKPRGRVRSVR